MWYELAVLKAPINRKVYIVVITYIIMKNMEVAMMGFENVIVEVLDMAWQKFAGGEVGAELGEKDYEFEEFVIEELTKRGAKGVVWYTDSPNCRFVVNFEGKFYDVDYVTYDIEELDEDEAVEKAMRATDYNEELAREILGVIA